VIPGAELPPWHGTVDATRMHVIALILGDPNVIHVDADAVRALGLGPAQVNQGPANIAYVLNMLAAAFPGGRVTQIRTRLLGHVFAGDEVVAGGRVISASDTSATCDVWLARADAKVLTGTATVEVQSARRRRERAL
jgi:3-hydroxybutyryl-CoA dehydratase